MDYDRFRALWHRALDAAGLLSFPRRPIETVKPGWMDRPYSIRVEPRSLQRAGPFHITAGLSWRWMKESEK